MTQAKCNKQLMSGFGGYPRKSVDYYQPQCSELEATISALKNKKFIPRGLGSSYGDSALSESVLSSLKLTQFIAFDAINGILQCQSGISLKEILQVIIPQGWFLAVTPGTQSITLGGAIASDVHGKNHHAVGCFSEFVDEIELLTAENKRITCSRKQESAMFHATCGGMGLTGFILSATIRLAKINSTLMRQQTFKSKNLMETLELLQQHRATYSVAWLDASAPMNQLGRSLIFLAEHADQGSLKFEARVEKNWPLSWASPLLNSMSIKLFNRCYYYGHRQSTVFIPLQHYFYPLDRLSGWNRLYGRAGFTQYQFVLPLDQLDILRTILLTIRQFGSSSFLSVLKIFGAENQNYLSFPMEGLTLAFDFKITDQLWPLLTRLDALVIEAGGRVYLTKDCRLTAENFHKMYPRWEEFLNIKNRCDPAGNIQSLQSQRLTQ